MITENQLRKIVLALGAEAGPWALTLTTVMDRFDITLPTRAAAFLAQVVHESSGFTRLVENLNYSAERLVKVWPRRFPSVGSAQAFAHQPEKLANLVYAGRMGNGPVESGDGWRFRGRGLIQLTGRENYARAGAALSMALVERPDLVAGPAIAALTAAWYWDSHGLNVLADAEDLEGITRAINGGLVGLEERRRIWEVAKVALV